MQQKCTSVNYLSRLDGIAFQTCESTRPTMQNPYSHNTVEQTSSEFLSLFLGSIPDKGTV